MKNSSLQKDLLVFIRDYNDGKIKLKDTNDRTVKSGNFKNGIASKEYIGIWLKDKFIDRLNYSKEEIEENLRLLVEDEKIKATQKDGYYSDTKEPIFLTSKGYDELSLFKRYPTYTSLGVLVAITTTITTIISAVFSVLTYFYK
jgi:hypothetical protein